MLVGRDTVVTFRWLVVPPRGRLSSEQLSRDGGEGRTPVRPSEVEYGFSL